MFCVCGLNEHSLVLVLSWSASFILLNIFLEHISAHGEIWDVGILVPDFDPYPDIACVVESRTMDGPPTSLLVKE